ncbi:ATP-binding cassette domain-containing protein [bacterium]|nr:ATP-binding cassette domain-containing protein [bacterium]
MHINTFTYHPGQFTVKNSHTIQLHDQVTALCGPVGSGKSSLIKLMADPELRHIQVLSDYPFPAYLSQDLTRLFTGNTVESIYQLYSASGTQIGNTFNKNKFKKICQLFNFPFDTYRKRKLHNFSQGELQRLAIALATSVDSPFALYDEPLTALNASYRKVFYKLIQEEKEHRRILIVSHSLRDIRCMADEFIWIQEGILHPPEAMKVLLENKEYLQYFRP